MSDMVHELGDGWQDWGSGCYVKFDHQAGTVWTYAKKQLTAMSLIHFTVMMIPALQTQDQSDKGGMSEQS